MAAMVVFAQRQSEACGNLIRSLKSEGADAVVATSIPELLDVLGERAPEVLVLDTDLCKSAGATLIPMVHSIAPQARIVLRADKSDLSDGAAIEAGVFFYAAGGDESYLTQVVRAALNAKRRT